MAEHSSSVNASAGHLAVHIPDAHPPEESFLFERRPRRMGWSFVASAIFDVSVFALLIVLSRLAPPTSNATAVIEPFRSDQIVWIPQEGPGGGGGGGGNQMKQPARAMELPGKDRMSVPVQKPAAVEPPKQEPNAEPPIVEPIVIPALTTASALESVTGVIEAPPGPPTPSQGSGTRGGSGTGDGTGSGPGTGPGLGPGTGGGVGDDVYHPGNGVTTPVPLDQVKPRYTSEAMRAHIQGPVLVECVVQPSGQCTNIQIVHSLDPTFGLDQEAVKAARKWRFKPGTRLGQPVPVLVTIELSFVLR